MHLSSSIYGDSTKFPLNENQTPRPKNIYGLSKKLNEQIANFYSNCFNMNCTGLRFLQFMENGGDRICLCLNYLRLQQIMTSFI